ncbi:hypothetical protein ACH5A7_07430 [Streptomyces sp. NPDC018955]|uniref:hypothetical protein n=1 Tax=Streptomyces sp. NPDC018955 TaxID=3365055 RepID=UPI0037A66F8A
MAICLLLVVAALPASNALLVTLLQRQLVGRLDERLRSAASAAARLPDLADLAGIPGGTGPRVRDVVESELTGDVYVAYLDAEGRVRRTPRPAATGAPRLPELDRAAVEARDERPFEATARGGGENRRVIAVPLGQADTTAGGSVVVAGSLDQAGTTIRHLGLRMPAIDSLVLALLGAIGWFAVRAGPRPLRRIETTAAAIAGGDPSRRAPRYGSVSAPEAAWPSWSRATRGRA